MVFATVTHSDDRCCDPMPRDPVSRILALLGVKDTPLRHSRLGRWAADAPPDSVSSPEPGVLVIDDPALRAFVRTVVDNPDPARADLDYTFRLTSRWPNILVRRGDTCLLFDGYFGDTCLLFDGYFGNNVVVPNPEERTHKAYASATFLVHIDPTPEGDPRVPDVALAWLFARCMPRSLPKTSEQRDVLLGLLDRLAASASGLPVSMQRRAAELAVFAVDSWRVPPDRWSPLLSGQDMAVAAAVLGRPAAGPEPVIARFIRYPLEFADPSLPGDLVSFLLFYGLRRWPVSTSATEAVATCIRSGRWPCNEHYESGTGAERTIFEAAVRTVWPDPVRFADSLRNGTASRHLVGLVLAVAAQQGADTFGRLVRKLDFLPEDTLHLHVIRAACRHLAAKDRRSQLLSALHYLVSLPRGERSTKVDLLMSIYDAFDELRPDTELLLPILQIPELAALFVPPLAENPEPAVRDLCLAAILSCPEAEGVPVVLDIFRHRGLDMFARVREALTGTASPLPPAVARVLALPVPRRRTYGRTNPEERIAWALRRFGPRLAERLAADVTAGDRSAESFLRLALEYDPTHGRFVPWIAARYATGGIRAAEDLGRVRSALDDFLSVRTLLKERDLNRYRTLVELEDAVEAIVGTPERLQEIEEVDPPLATTLADTPDLLVKQLHNWAAARKYGAGTRWCVSSRYDPTAWMDHASFGERLIWVLDRTNNSKYLFSLPSGDIADASDQPLGFSELVSAVPSLTRHVPGLVAELFDACYAVRTELLDPDSDAARAILSIPTLDEAVARAILTLEIRSPGIVPTERLDRALGILGPWSQELWRYLSDPSGGTLPGPLRGTDPSDFTVTEVLSWVRVPCEAVGPEASRRLILGRPDLVALAAQFSFIGPMWPENWIPRIREMLRREDLPQDVIVYWLAALANATHSDDDILSEELVEAAAEVGDRLDRAHQRAAAMQLLASAGRNALLSALDRLPTWLARMLGDRL